MGSRAFGILVIAFGVLWFLSAAGIGLPGMSAGEFFSTFWPLFVIYAGVSSLWWSRKVYQKTGIRGLFWSNIWAVGLILVGVLLQLDKLGVLTFSFWGIVAPALLILFGLSLVFGQKYRHRGKTSIEWYEEWNDHGKQLRNKIGDLKIAGPGRVLEDMRIEKKLGAILLDMSEMVIPEGETTVEISCKAGDVDVLVPAGLAVEVEAGVKVGDVKVFAQRNSGHGQLRFKSDDYDTAERKVKLRVYVKFGDIDVVRV
jgi:lia operon protein LiaF